MERLRPWATLPAVGHLPISVLSSTVTPATPSIDNGPLVMSPFPFPEYSHDDLFFSDDSHDDDNFGLQLLSRKVPGESLPTWPGCLASVAKAQVERNTQVERLGSHRSIAKQIEKLWVEREGVIDANAHSWCPSVQSLPPRCPCMEGLPSELSQCQHLL